MLLLNKINKNFNIDTVDEKVALSGIQLTVADGDFVTIIGSNGAGKSTLMNIIAGVIFPDSGDIFIENKNITTLAEYKRSSLIGRVFQNPMMGTCPSMTIEENLSLALSRSRRRTLKKALTQKRRDFFKQHLKSLHLGLEERMSAKVGLLSGGERQALSLLMATFTQPKILLLDEHTAALDPTKAELLTNLTNDIVNQNQLTTLMITHNMQQALQLGNRLIMMDKGQIIFEANAIEKRTLTIEKLMKEFRRIKGTDMMNDKILLD